MILRIILKNVAIATILGPNFYGKFGSTAGGTLRIDDMHYEFHELSHTRTSWQMSRIDVAFTPAANNTEAEDMV
jgi:hypothetical protein